MWICSREDGGVADGIELVFRNGCSSDRCYKPDDILYHTVPPEVETAPHISLFTHARCLSDQNSLTRLVLIGQFGYLYAASSTPGENSPAL